MVYRFSLVLMLLLSGCTASRQRAQHGTDAEVPQRFELHVQFEAAEDVKRVPLQVPALRMELLKELSAPDRLYLVSVECRRSQVDGVVQKLNETKGVLRAVRVTF